ncbi:hypothetical protein [Arcanobacterium phocae]|uniref:hypothetical protein n=1 Tax=Arcanobacterium phocae TaxID=131112 RepID=UPI001C0F3888|nr:hypothetical protein [Arcanobacterium phocae]
MSFFKRKTAAEKAADEAKKLKDQAANATGTFFAKVADAYQTSRTWAEPRIEEAAEKLVPVAQQAVIRANTVARDAYERTMPYVEEAVTKAKPYVEEAVTKAKPYVDDAQAFVAESTDRVKDDYLPRAKKAANAAIAEMKAGADEQATKITKLSKKEMKKAKKAAKKAEKKAMKLTKKQKKKGHGKKIFGLTLLVGSALGVAYVAWARSKPVEDPWAEAYWEDLAVPTEDSTDFTSFKEAVDSVKEQVEDGAEKASEVADEVKEAATEVANEVAERVTPLDVAEQLEDK